MPDGLPLSRLTDDPILMERTRTLLDRPVKPGPVIYWMSRDQRADDNWALIFAAQSAARLNQPVVILFFLHQGFLQARPGDRHYQMMLAGLQQTRDQLRALNMAFYLLPAPASEWLPQLTDRLHAGLIVTDFSPLREIMDDRTETTKRIGATNDPCPVVEVDAHNVVPWHQVSNKREFAARTIRPKIHRLTGRYLVDYPQISFHPYPLPDDQCQLLQNLSLPEWPMTHMIDSAFPTPGAEAGKRALKRFIHERLPLYGLRNDPNQPVTSNLSPYFHFGQVSPARAALAALESGQPDNGFLEELIIRRELSDNYCAFEPNYDRYDSLPAWGLRTLDAHRLDPRSRVYPRGQMEEGETDDPLWNAAQKELLHTGKIAGYMRMYWAKKILEWRPDPEDAFDFAITLNDRYALDGRDPNGYVGVAWSIGGLHDRPFSERPVFGQVRYMSYEGCRRKFDVNAYIQRMSQHGRHEERG